MITTLVFEKNANFFAENCPKSQKIVTVASTHKMPTCKMTSNTFPEPLELWYSLSSDFLVTLALMVNMLLKGLRLEIS
jgi:hypothetical protein